MARNDTTRRVGRYTIVRELGSGGAATVYLARQLDLDRLVALKELHAAGQSDPAFARRFLREARVAGSLSHPNIVTVHDYFERGGTPYIAMEFVPRGSLRPYIGRLTVAQAGGVLADVLAGLAHAERRGIVHRDLKPENLLVTDDGRIKIADFGIAKATHSIRTMAHLTATGTTLGTPNYMAPEQALGEEVGPSSDLYSVGIVAFEMLVGQVPFRDTEAPMAVLMRQVNEPVPPVASLRPDVDPEVSRWVEGLLVKDPEKRTQSAAAAWEGLDEALSKALSPRWNREAGLTEGVDHTVPAFETPVTARPSLRRTSTTVAGSREARTLAPRRTAATAPAPAPVPDSRREGGGRRPWLLAAPVLALAIAGVALGMTRAGSPAGPAAVGATPAGFARAAGSSAEELSVAVPAGWKPLRAVPKTGLPLAGARALGPGGRSDGPAVAYGVVSRRRAGNPALLPAPFLESLGQSAGGIPKRDEVVLSDRELPAWRYRDLRPLGSTRALTVYVVPTDAGVATVACLAPDGARAASAGTCDAIAATLRLRRAKPYPTGPSDAYAAALTGTLGELRRDADRRGPALAVARTAADRSREARALAADYDRAARRFAALTLSPADEQVNRRLVAALRRVGRAYGAVARTAAGSTAAFDSSRAAAARAEQAIDGALVALRAAGYSATSGGGAAGSPAPAKDAPADSAPASDAPAGSAPTTARPAPAPSQPCDPDSEGASDDPSDDAGGCDEP